MIRFFYTCMPARIRDVAVETTLSIVPTEFIDSVDPALDNLVFLDDGDNVTFANGTNIPYCGGQSKYLQKIKTFI